jgi:hypothetical protein
MALSDANKWWTMTGDTDKVIKMSDNDEWIISDDTKWCWQVMNDDRWWMMTSDNNNKWYQQMMNISDDNKG